MYFSFKKAQIEPEIVKTGHLSKKGGGPAFGWKKRFFALTKTGELYYYKPSVFLKFFF